MGVGDHVPGRGNSIERKEFGRFEQWKVASVPPVPVRGGKRPVVLGQLDHDAEFGFYSM